MSTRAVFAPWLLALGCAASLPRPTVLGEVDSARQSPAMRQAAERAPQAHAHAEALAKRAEAAYRAGDTASAQILGEHALAAFERAAVLARLASAERRRGEAAARLRKAEEELGALDEQQKRTLAEAEGLELRARVARDTLPLPESGAAATPERERARLEAARALALSARLLCASARLLDVKRSELAALVKELDTLDARVSEKTPPAPIDAATRLRSRCLAELSSARRASTAAAPASGKADELLGELARAAYAPVRDDRGVVVTLRGVFGPGATLTPTAQQTLGALGRVARAHPDFPVLVVLHTARGRGTDKERKQLDSAGEALRQAGAARLDVALGGDASPVLDPARNDASERNARLEIVFVAPSAS